MSSDSDDDDVLNNFCQCNYGFTGEICADRKLNFFVEVFSWPWPVLLLCINFIPSLERVTLKP